MFSCQKESNNIEEFSFPVVSNNNNVNPLSNFMLSSSSASSSSLWRISSRVYHHQEDYNCYYEDRKEEDDDRMEVRSMCEEITPCWRDDIERSMSFQGKDVVEVEESMDYLWEDFNGEEEKEKFKVRRRRSSEEIMSFMQVTKMGRASPSSNSSSGGGTKMLVIGKFLKGLVSFRKSSQLKFSKPRF